MSNQAPKKQNGFFGNLAFNIIIPVVIMSNLSSDEYLGPAWSIVAALILSPLPIFSCADDAALTISVATEFAISYSISLL